MGKKSTRTRRLQTKIGGLLILMTTLILGLYGSYQYGTLKAEKHAALQMLADQALERLTNSLMLPLWNYDAGQAERSIEAEMRAPEIYAIIVRTDKSLFAGRIRDKEWNMIGTQEGVAEEVIQRRNLIVLRHDIVKDEHVLGTVEVYPSRRFIREQLRRELQGLGLTVLILDAALFAAIIVIIRRLFIHPLRHLLTLADAIAAGDFRQEITIRQRDEIGEFAAAFRRMSVPPAANKTQAPCR